MATKKETKETDDLRVDPKRVANELEDLFEVLREQEEKLDNLYNIASSLKVMAIAVQAIASDFGDTNEELFRKARELKAVTVGHSD